MDENGIPIIGAGLDYSTVTVLKQIIKNILNILN
jgi:hypothetical protein